MGAAERITIKTRDFVRLGATMKTRAIEVYGLDTQASEIAGKQIPNTPPGYAVAVMRVWASITSELLDRWLRGETGLGALEATLGAAVNGDDLSPLPVTQWPHDRIVAYGLSKETPPGARAGFEALGKDGSGMYLAIASPMIPIVGDGLRRNTAGFECMASAQAARFWMASQNTAIDLAFLGDASLTAEAGFSDFLALSRDEANELSGTLARGAANAAVEIAKTAGQIAGSVVGGLAEGLFGGLGFGGIVVVGGLAYVGYSVLKG